MAELVSRDGNKVEFKVAVPAAEVNRMYEQVWAGLARDVRVPGFRPGKAQAKFKRLGAEKQRQRHNDRTELVGRTMRNDSFETLRQQDRDPVAAFDAQSPKARCHRIGARREFTETQNGVICIVYKRGTIRIAGSPQIGNRNANVETRRDIPAEIPIERVVVLAPFQQAQSPCNMARTMPLDLRRS